MVHGAAGAIARPWSHREQATGHRPETEAGRGRGAGRQGRTDALGFACQAVVVALEAGGDGRAQERHYADTHALHRIEGVPHTPLD